MTKGYLNGLMLGAGFLTILILGITIAFAADILTVDKDGTIRLRVSDQGKVTLNTSDAAQGDLRFTPRTTDPTTPLGGDLWFNSIDRQIKYSDISGKVKPLAPMTNEALTLYVNGAQADDSGDGLTLAGAKKYIQSAVNLVPPVVNHAVTINVSTGTYRDAGATGINVYVANKYVGATGAIVFVGDEATPANVRVTGSDAGADTTPVRNYGFYINGVKNVTIKGFLCNYFNADGIIFISYSSGAPVNCIASNNLRGILYMNSSMGSPSNCTATNNSDWGIRYQGLSNGSPTSCSAGSNYGGILYTYSCIGSPTSCTISSNTSTGIYYGYKSTGGPTNNGGTGNGAYGVYAAGGSTVDVSGTTPDGTLGSTGEDAGTYSKIF